MRSADHVMLGGGIHVSKALLQEIVSIKGGTACILEKFCHYLQ